jgi:hypothetical protein
MFTAPPSKDDIAKMENLGLTLGDYAGDDVEVWPENQRAYFLFAEIRTQWRVGPVGPTGLDYNTLFRKMDRMRLEPDEYDELEADIRTMEFAALEAMSARD